MTKKEILPPPTKYVINLPHFAHTEIYTDRRPNAFIRFFYRILLDVVWRKNPEYDKVK